MYILILLSFSLLTERILFFIITLIVITGIGGFQVRARAKKDEEKAREEAEMDPQALEMRRRRSKWRTKKKIKLLEKFPSYIQVRNYVLLMYVIF